MAGSTTDTVPGAGPGAARRNAPVRRTRASHARRGVLKAVPSARHGLSALVVGACVVAYTVFATAPSFVLGPSDGTTESDHFAGVWLGGSPAGEGGPPDGTGQLSAVLRLDIDDSTRIGWRSGSFVAASSGVLCRGEFSVAGRTRLSLGIAAFKVTSSSPEGATAEECRLPDSLRLTKNEGLEYVMAETDDHLLFRMERRAAPATQVPRPFSNVWSSGDGLVVDIRAGGLGEPVVRTIQSTDGRHCEYTASLLHVGRDTLLAAAPVPDQEMSDPGCWWEEGDIWEYFLEPGRPPVLVRRTGDLDAERRLHPVR